MHGIFLSVQRLHGQGSAALPTLHYHNIDQYLVFSNVVEQ